MTDDLDVLFAAYVADVDSAPFAHEAAVDAAITAMVPVVPTGGAGCIVYGALAVAVLAVLVVVSQLVMAVTS